MLLLALWLGATSPPRAADLLAGAGLRPRVLQLRRDLPGSSSGTGASVATTARPGRPAPTRPRSAAAKYAKAAASATDAHRGEIPKVVAARLGRSVQLFRPFQGIDFDVFFERRIRSHVEIAFKRTTSLAAPSGAYVAPPHDAAPDPRRRGDVARHHRHHLGLAGTAGADPAFVVLPRSPQRICRPLRSPHGRGWRMNRLRNPDAVTLIVATPSAAGCSTARCSCTAPPATPALNAALAGDAWYHHFQANLLADGSAINLIEYYNTGHHVVAPTMTPRCTPSTSPCGPGSASTA
ncbi:MAG: hypothetical protein R2695_05630 [Acidimicrobiales bacterium]